MVDRLQGWVCSHRELARVSFLGLRSVFGPIEQVVLDRETRSSIAISHGCLV